MVFRDNATMPGDKIVWDFGCRNPTLLATRRRALNGNTAIFHEIAGAFWHVDPSMFPKQSAAFEIKSSVLAD
ncbi:hypothetical protein, partial [Klebsiella variicola]|uniref:hypothetical protein n=1 Tax=Klebsiella variicola TaxID=244366 RepID=UPI002731C11E